MVSPSHSNNYGLLCKFESDDAFSIETGLELGGIAGPIRCLWMSGSSTKIRNKKGSVGITRCLSDA